MFSCERTVFVKETDATGAIYFTSLFTYALEAFELFLSKEKIKLAAFFDKGFFIPIVRSEADFSFPLKTGDLITVTVSLSHKGTSSFSLESKIFLMPERKIAGQVKITHVFMRSGEEKSSPLPEDLQALLLKLAPVN